MPALITGAQGQLGRDLARLLPDATALGREQLPIDDEALVRRRLAEARPEIVYNCAAYNAVDAAEKDPEPAIAVNARGPENLARACLQVGARLVHFSTNYVFDGEATEPYRENHPTGPRSVYGESKLEGERQALAVPGSLVVRTSWIFGVGGPNFVDAIAGKIRAGERRLRVVEDQRGAPTWAPFLASALADLGEWGTSGIVHYQNRPDVTWYGVALEIARALAPAGEVDVEPITTAEMPRPARRPAYSVLAVERFEALAGRRVESWRDGLDRHLGVARAN